MTGEHEISTIVDEPVRPSATEPLRERAARPGATESFRARPPVRELLEGPTCNRCGSAVFSRPWGCKNPCPNCGTVYPLGDCSD